MKKFLFVLLSLLVVFASCNFSGTREGGESTPTETDVAITEDYKRVTYGDEIGDDPFLALNLSGLSDEDWAECDVEAMKIELEESDIQGVHPDQITACYSLADMTFAFVSQPNTYTALIDVREWEAEENEAWSGLLFQAAEGPLTVFLQIPQDDYNPIGLYLEEEALMLDTVDDSGAGSGEGQLLTYVYPFAGVVEDSLYEWVAEQCTSYYVPEVYVKGAANCE